MLVCSKFHLAFVAVPKTGTTAIEAALRPLADICFARQRKHIPAQSFRRRIAPFLADTLNCRPDCFAVIRAPEDQLRSWYLYRARPANADNPKSTRGISFDTFVQAVLSDDPPPFADVGSQWNMVTGHGRVLVDHLFAYEDPTVLQAFLDTRFEREITLERRNVSPCGPADLTPATRDLLRRKRAREFDLHAQVRAQGGHLQTDMGWRELGAPVMRGLG
ncbi:MAG: hypothetical protein OIF47_05765 [Marinibacterium sp.]|nr:hypothetical protein [Marinibacterium sp.]